VGSLESAQKLPGAMVDASVELIRCLVGDTTQALCRYSDVVFGQWR
jgi:hypothetical protein